MNSNTRIYIANLGKYNEGELVGEWIDLPFTDEEYESLLVRIKLGKMVDNEYVHGCEEGCSIYEEYAIHDYESDLDIEIGEWDSPEDLSALFEEIEDLDEYEYEALKAALEVCGGELEDALDAVQNGEVDFYPNATLEDVASEMVDEGFFATETLMDYIDFERLGRDLSYDGYTETSNGVIYMQ